MGLLIQVIILVTFFGVLVVAMATVKELFTEVREHFSNHCRW